MLEINKIYNIDCMEGLEQLDDNSIDSIVTDPPYELGFMGKSWDKTGIAYNVELWKECLRVLKPGGHLLAFGGTRTYHRMVCVIEDAGFEIRDQIQWIYGSGFPKSIDISKSIDRMLGVEREIIEGGIGKKSGETYSKNGGYIAGRAYFNKPISPEAKQWEGWGIALKPANEPICVARKPLSEKNVALNVLKWGTGGINIDECRIPVNWKEEYPPSWFTSGKSKENAEDYWGKGNIKKNTVADRISDKGRFPANVILDEEATRMLDGQSGNLSPASTQIRKPSHDKEGQLFNLARVSGIKQSYGDKGGVSRFFYCAKASKKERWFYCIECKDVFPMEEYEQHNHSSNCRVVHPTVKPLKLIEYLVKLVTPPNGICLDPFEGSGTHAVACINLGFNYIGFELNKEYYEIAKNRINKHILDNNLQDKYSLIT